MKVEGRGWRKGLVSPNLIAGSALKYNQYKHDVYFLSSPNYTYRPTCKLKVYQLVQPDQPFVKPFTIYAAIRYLSNHASHTIRYDTIR